MSEIAIIADDLTGALDAAVHFAHLGRSSLALSGPPSDAYAVALSTASRALSAAAARSAAESASRSAPATRLFVKIDSTLRGNPAAHLDGALDAWRRAVPGAFAVICPALPAMGRTVHLGVAFDHGVPITRSAAATDPISSPRSSALTDVFPGTMRAEDLTNLAQGTNVVVDAQTDDELDELAAAIERIGPRAVAVGSAGLAAAIARRSAGRVPRLDLTAGRTLVVVTSAHPVSRAQLAQIDPTATVVSTEDWDGAALAPGDARAAATAVAVRAAALLATGDFGSLVLIGGDGAHATLAQLGATSLDVEGELMPGVPIGVLRGGSSPGLVVTTRSGGFGGPTHLHEILTAMHNLRTMS